MPGREYWKKRMEDIEKKSHDKGLEYVEFTEKQFYRAQRNIDKEIAKWYAKMATNNEISYSAAQELLRRDELEEFHWTVEEYIKKGEVSNYTDQWNTQLKNASAKVHISRLEAMKLQMQQECEVLYGNLHDGLDEKLKDIYTEGCYRTAYEIQKGTGVGYAFNRLDTRKIEEAVDTAWALDGKTFSNRIWQDKDKLVRELGQELTQSVIMGGDYTKAIDRLSKRLNVSKHNAGRLIMTESAAIHARSQKKCFEELGVKEFEFLATLDSHTSEICQEMDGQHFPMEQYEIGVTAPPLHPWCRSCTIPYFEDDKAVSKRAARGEDGKTYLVPADMTYPEWKKTFIKDADEKFDDSGLQLLESARNGVIINKITQQNIDNVSLQGLDAFSGEEQSELENAHKKVLSIAMNENESKEVAMLLDENMSEIAIVMGEATEIDLNVSGRSKAKYVIHNHPNNSSFSNRDILWFANNDATQFFSIVKNNGEVEVVTKGKDFNKRYLETEMLRLIKKYQKDIEADEQKGYNKIVKRLLETTKSGIVYKR